MEPIPYRLVRGKDGVHTFPLTGLASLFPTRPEQDFTFLIPPGLPQLLLCVLVSGWREPPRLVLW